MTNTTKTRRRNVPSYCPAYRRMKLRIAGHLEVKRLARLALAVGVLAGMMGCRATVATPAAETVGQLAPSYASIATAPIHHDAPPEFAEVVDSGDDDSNVATTVSVPAEKIEAPEIAPKGGIVLGTVRQ